MISLIIVNYRTAALTADAVRSARAATTTPMQVTVVDNSCDAAEAERLRGIGDVLLVSSTNRGYAGGINDGRRVCNGETIVVANPDVVFSEGTLDALHDALDDKTAVAGPALYWDDAHQWMLPPADLNRLSEKLDEILASRSRTWFEARDRRRFRKRVAFWSLNETTEVKALSGAVMAIRASEFDALNGFDERFGLYFEEIDFLRRISERRRRIVYVPAAKCRHLYNQSAGQNALAAGAAYARSEMKYLEKWNGPFAARVLKRLERAPLQYDARPMRGPIEVDRDDVVIEASPLASFATAAGSFPRERQVDLPPDVLQAVKNGELFLRLVDRASGHVFLTWRRGRNMV